MLFSEDIAGKVATELLNIEAVKIDAVTPFRWASGRLSPIYCDNRTTLSCPDLRTLIKESFIKAYKAHFDDVTAIVGVATAGIAHGALLADALNLPFSYVRSSAKAHGMRNRIEGRIEDGSRVLVIEDLISTGMSSLAVVDVLKGSGLDIAGMMGIFTYGLEETYFRFQQENVKLVTLSDYSTIVSMLEANQSIDRETYDLLHKWRRDPKSWSAEAEKSSQSA